MLTALTCQRITILQSARKSSVSGSVNGSSPWYTMTRRIHISKREACGLPSLPVKQVLAIYSLVMIQCRFSSIAELLIYEQVITSSTEKHEVLTKRKEVAIQAVLHVAYVQPLLRHAFSSLVRSIVREEKDRIFSFRRSRCSFPR